MIVLQEAQVYARHATHRDSEVDMVNKLSVDCPCGFSFVTPHGEEDALAVVQLHIDRVHKADYPQGISRADALAHIKEVK